MRNLDICWSAISVYEPNISMIMVIIISLLFYSLFLQELASTVSNDYANASMVLPCLVSCNLKRKGSEYFNFYGVVFFIVFLKTY